MAILFNKHRPETNDDKAQDLKFLKGNIFSHVVSASLISSIGILILFLVDLVDIYFIGLLGEPKLAAAVGFAGTIIFFNMALAIAGMITVATLLAGFLGASQTKKAKTFHFHCLIFGLILSCLIGLIFFYFRKNLLMWTGASGETLEFALQYFSIVIISYPILYLAMLMQGLLRAQGDFVAATIMILLGGLTNAALDPLFIFTFNFGLEGAAMASVCSRFAMFFTALFYVIWKYDFFTGALSFEGIRQNLLSCFKTFLPVSLSNLSTPIGNGFVINLMAAHGVGLVAGIAVIGRITPLLFVVILSLSGAIGPIIGQNFGAKQFDRSKEVVRDSIIFSIGYVLLASFLLFLARNYVGDLFNLGPEGKKIISFYAAFISYSFLFVAVIFIANAFFNNIGKPVIAMAINFLRNIVFLIPFIYAGNWFGGAKGILIGQAVGAFCVALIALMLMGRLFHKWDEGANEVKTAN